MEATQNDKPLKRGKIVENTFKSFKSEDDIDQYFAQEPVHCVSCQQDLTGSEEFDHELRNALAIPIKKEDGKMVTSVPRIVCKCGYKNTVLKLLYQTIPEPSAA